MTTATTAPPPTLSLVFWGHACFGLHIDGAPFLLIDPFDPKGLGGVDGPPPVTQRYPWVIATHEHSDHAAYHTQPDATVLAAPGECGPLRLDYRPAAHDPLGGRLRGGSIRMLEIRAFGKRLIHCSDLGERPYGDTLEWLRAADLLIIPAGGYFTLTADGAAELVESARPKRAIFCHTRDDGLALPHLAPQAVIRRRSAHWQNLHYDELDLMQPAATDAPEICWMSRPSRRADTRITHG